MSSGSHRSTSRRLGGSLLALVVMAGLAAGLLPTCVDSLCCLLAGEPSVEAQMACCESSIGPRDLPLPAVTSAASAMRPNAAATAVASGLPRAASPPLAPDLPAGRSGAHYASPPPLFLLNAQLLI